MHYAFLATASLMLLIAVAFLFPPQRGGRSLLRLPVLLGVAVVSAFATGTYIFVGSPGAIGAAATPEQQPIAALVAGLQARLAANPDDKDGWLLLARSYRYLGAHDKARAAVARAEAADARVMHTTQADGTSMRGRVTLASALIDRVDPNDTVFIFAKESRTQRIPVAALRRRVRDLPMDFEISDKHTMVAGTRLADFDSLVVTARISPTGRAADASSRFETWSDPIVPDRDSFVELVIAREAAVKDYSNE